MSRARHELTGAKLAPKDEATLKELRNRRPQEQLREIASFPPETVRDKSERNRQVLLLDKEVLTRC